MACDISSNYAVSLTHQEIDQLDDTLPSVLHFSIINSPKATDWVQLELEEFLHNDYKSHTTVSKLLLSSLQIDDAKAREWIILEIMSKTCTILHDNVSERNKIWLINVEIIDSNNKNSLGEYYYSGPEDCCVCSELYHSGPEVCCFCSESYYSGPDYCQTCLSDEPTQNLYVQY